MPAATAAIHREENGTGDRIGKTRGQQQRLRRERHPRATELARIALTHKQIAQRLGFAGSTVAALLAKAIALAP